MRLVALTLGLLLASICLSIHAATVWLGITACVLFVAGFVSLTGPALRPAKSFPTQEATPHA